jgi:hypothetical protein
LSQLPASSPATTPTAPAPTQQTDPSPIAALPQPAGDTATAEDVWSAALKQLTGLVGEHARFASRPTVEGDGNLAIFFAPRYNRARAFCERFEPIAQLTEAVSAAAGRPLRVRIAVDSAPEAADSDAPESGTDGPTRRADALQNPLVVKAVELFEARPIRVDEPE